MRPIKLTLQAFGPFVDKTTIPFEKLGISNIYLISGSTGSGKTTIFDAICYALFNTSSGTNRGTQTLRSHFAKDEIESFVELDFIFNNEKYSILRHPSYERKKARGEGIITQQAKAQITLPNGKIIEKQKDVDDFVKELLGIDANQFSQIALLAQGEFLKILNSDTQTRGEIFRSIFKTWDFANFQNKLKDKVFEYKNQYQNLENSILQYISNIVSKENELENLCKNYIENKCFNNLDELIDLLNKQNAQDNNNLIEIQNEITKLEKNIEFTQNEFQKIQNKINLQNQKENLIKEKEKSELDFENIKKEYEQKDKIENEIQKLSLEIKKADEDYQKSLKIKELLLNKEKINSGLILKNKEKEKLQEKINIFKLQHLQNISNEYTFLEKEKTIKQTLFIKQQKETESLVKIYNKEFNSYLEAQAGIIAQNLKENEPCPVCGSLVHPNVAKLKDENLTKEHIDSLKNKLEEENEKLINLSKECSILNEKIKLKSKDFITISKKYNLDIDLAEYKIPANNFEEIIEEHFELLEKIEKEILLFNNEIISIDSKIEGIKNESTLSDIDLILSLHEKLNKDLITLQEKLKNIEESYNNKNIELNSIKSKIKLLEEQLQNEEKLNISIILNLENKIQEFKQKISNYDKEIEIIISRKSINERNLKEISLKNKEFIKISSLYNNHKILSDCANGTLKGKTKIAFEQYIQSYYLDLVLFEANKRLKIMSNNQFQLTRKTDTFSHQAKVGLDLEVIDFHTFKKRSTKTLSGGESFKAALALALGLSDCVSNFSGAINIDAMFIDEGFGSLDSESLELALEVIYNTSNTNRLIGIISHIDELKTKIQNQINTFKTQNGSTLEINF